MSNSFVEKWADRKVRVANAKHAAKAGTTRKLGFWMTPEGEHLAMRSYERTQSMTSTAKELKCNRATVRRILLRNKVAICDGRRRLGAVNGDFFEFYARIPGPIYRQVRTAAKLNNRKIAREVVAALAKLYL